MAKPSGRDGHNAWLVRDVCVEVLHFAHEPLQLTEGSTKHPRLRYGHMYLVVSLHSLASVGADVITSSCTICLAKPKELVQVE